jgi:hypothetical protein
VFPVTYEHHLHIKNVKLSPKQTVEVHRCVSCEVRTPYTHKKSNNVPVTDRGGL